MSGAKRRVQVLPMIKKEKIVPKEKRGQSGPNHFYLGSMVHLQYKYNNSVSTEYTVPILLMNLITEYSNPGVEPMRKLRHTKIKAQPLTTSTRNVCQCYSYGPRLQAFQNQNWGNDMPRRLNIQYLLLVSLPFCPMQLRVK